MKNLNNIYNFTEIHIEFKLFNSENNYNPNFLGHFNNFDNNYNHFKYLNNNNLKYANKNHLFIFFVKIFVFILFNNNFDTLYIIYITCK